MYYQIKSKISSEINLNTVFIQVRKDIDDMDEARRKQLERETDNRMRKVRRDYFFDKVKFRLGKKPMQYKEIEVPDWNERSRQLSGFRKAYQSFFASDHAEENSELQNYSTPMLWHRMYLQKRRMERLGITMVMDSKRVKRSNVPGDSIREETESDGRYQIVGVNESIAARRRFIHCGQEIGCFDNHESLNYYVLTAHRQGENEIMCPNCGSISTRENLIDGCDYCGTRFTIEDLQDKIGCFDFQYESAKEGDSEKVLEVHRYFARNGGQKVKEFDPNFSMREFSENLYNKLAAIHYADSFREVNAFSDDSLAHLMDNYKNVVNMEPWDIRLRFNNPYSVENGLQELKCWACFRMFEFVDGKILIREENVNVTLEKSASSKTQSICAPAVFKCKGCGRSLSLMDGKTCEYCNKEIDMRQYDWVITKYESILRDYKKNLYDI